MTTRDTSWVNAYRRGELVANSFVAAGDIGAMINAACAAIPNGGEVVSEDGDYVQTTRVVIPDNVTVRLGRGTISNTMPSGAPHWQMKDNTSLVGAAGWATKIMAQVMTTGQAITVSDFISASDNGLLGNTNLLVQDIQFIRNPDSTTDGVQSAAVQFGNTTNVIVDHCYFNGCEGYGVFQASSSVDGFHGDGFTVKNCLFENITTQHCGVINCANFKIKDNLFRPTTAMANYTVIDCESNTGADVLRNFEITGNIFDYVTNPIFNPGSMIQVAGGGGGTPYKAAYGGRATYGIISGNICIAGDFSNNGGFFAQGINLAFCDEITVSDNHVFGASIPISIGQCNSIKIHNNTTGFGKNNDAWHILLGDAFDCVVSDNQCVEHFGASWSTPNIAESGSSDYNIFRGNHVAFYPYVDTITSGGRYAKIDILGANSRVFDSVMGPTPTPVDAPLITSTAELRVLDIPGTRSANAPAVVVLGGRTAQADGGWSPWYYDPLSTLDDNDITVVKPSNAAAQWDGVGRWLRAPSQIKLTTTQRDALVLTAADAGLAIWNTTTAATNAWDGVAWVASGSAAVTRGLVTWLKADAGVQFDGSNNVTAWLDHSGAGIIAQYVPESPYAAPVYSATGGPNNGPRVTFGTTAALLSDTTLLSQGGPRTIIAVAKAADQAGGALFANKKTSPVFAAQLVADQYLYSDGVTLNIQVNGARPGPLRDDYAQLFIATFSTKGTGDLLGVRLNGKACPTDGGTVAVDSGSDGTIIGNRENVSNHLGWQGEIYELLVYDVELTAEEVKAVHSSLSGKYGVALGNETIVQYETHSLWNGAPPVGTGDAELDVYLPPPGVGVAIKRPAVIYCPGGGYSVVDTSAGRDVCAWLANLGYVAIVLKYRLPDSGLGFPGSVPLADVQRAIRTVRAGASGIAPAVAWGIDPDRIGIAGESAGGHLASTAATHYDAGNPMSGDPIEKESCKPNFSLLLWPIIEMQNPYQYSPATNAFIGTSGLEATYSNDLHVDENTPPSFLTWADDDAVVDPHNAMLYRDALIAAGVSPVDTINFATGNHGEGFPGSTQWVEWKKAFYTWLHNVVTPVDMSKAATPTFQNGVTNLGSGFQPVTYIKDGDGRVHLDGVITGGVGPNVVMFTLPAGCRPAAKVIAICAGSVSGTFTAARVNIDIDGTVTHISGAGDFMSLSGISFLATQ